MKLRTTALVAASIVLVACSSVSIGVGFPIGRVGVGVGATIPIPEKPASAPGTAASVAKP